MTAEMLGWVCVMAEMSGCSAWHCRIHQVYEMSGGDDPQHSGMCLTIESRVHMLESTCCRLHNQTTPLVAPPTDPRSAWRLLICLPHLDTVPS